MLQQGLAEFVERVRDAPARRDGADAPAAQILLAHVDDPRQFGVAAVERGRRGPAPGREARSTRRRTSRSSASTSSTRASTRRSRAIEPSARGELEITDAIQWLLDHGHRVRHEVLAGLVDRHRQEGPAARVQPAACSRRSSPRNDGKVDERVEHRGPRRDRGRRARSSNSRVRGPAIIGERHACREQLRRPVHLGRRRLRGRRLRARPLGRARPGSRIVGHRPAHRLAHRPPRRGRPLRPPSARAAAHARRPLEGGADDSMATVTESDVIAGVYIVEPDDPRRRARLLHRDVPPRVVPAGPRDDPGQPRRPPGRVASSACTTTCTRPTTGTCRTAGAGSCCTTCAPARRPTAPRSPIDLGAARRRHARPPRRLHPAGRRARLRRAHRHDDHLPRRRLLQPGRRARRRVGRPRDRRRLGRRRPDPLGPRPEEPGAAPSSTRNFRPYWGLRPEDPPCDSS